MSENTHCDQMVMQGSAKAEAISWNSVHFFSSNIASEMNRHSGIGDLDRISITHRIIFRILNMTKELLSKDRPKNTPAQLFKLLDHPARIAILEILREGEHCVCHMEAYLGLRQAYISQQLSVLRDAGLIQDRRDGWNIFYRVSDPGIYRVLDSVRKFTGEDFPVNEEVKAVCTCPHCSKRVAGSQIS